MIGAPGLNTSNHQQIQRPMTSPSTIDMSPMRVDRDNYDAYE